MNAKRFDPVRAIEACYAGVPDDQAWLAGLARAFEPLSFDLGVAALLWEIRSGHASCAAHAAVGPAPIDLADALAIWSAEPPNVVEAWFAAVSPVDTARSRLRKLAEPGLAAPLDAFAARGIADGLGITARDPTGRHVHVWLMSSRVVRVGPRTQHRLARVAAHLATAARLRANARPVAETVLDPAGEVLPGEGAAGAHEARASLASAVRRTERARGRLRRIDPDEALELWRGLFEGRWSLVDHVEFDGSRVVLARRNLPGALDPKALSDRERDVLAHVVLGHSNRYVGGVMGLSPATVASHLKGALSKLGVRSRGQVIRLLSGAGAGPATAAPLDGERMRSTRSRPRPLLTQAPGALAAPRGLVASRLAGQDDVALLEWPTSVPSTPDGLTGAEREVLALVREGLSNTAIAKRRGRSARTVANQIASIFAKCGVRSRAGLFALASGRGVRATE